LGELGARSLELGANSHQQAKVLVKGCGLVWECQTSVGLELWRGVAWGKREAVPSTCILYMHVPIQYLAAHPTTSQAVT
jgi:uncharacterized membrane protein (DUF2068 family)